MACLAQELGSSCWGKRTWTGTVVCGDYLSSMHMAECCPLPPVFCLEGLLSLDALSSLPMAQGLCWGLPYL